MDPIPNNTVPPIPQVTPPTPPMPPNSPQQEPKKTDVLGIISIVMGFTGMQLIGLIIGIIGINKAKEEGRSPKVSRAGRNLNAIMIVGIILLGLFFVFSLRQMFGGSDDSFFNDTKKIFSYGIEAITSQSQQNKDRYNTLTSGKKDFSKGETAKFGGTEITINKVIREYAPAHQYDKPQAGYELIVLDITTKNISTDNLLQIGDSDLSVDDMGYPTARVFVPPPGQEYRVTDDPKVSKGQLVYEVVKGAKDLKLTASKTAHKPGSLDPEVIFYTLAF